VTASPSPSPSATPARKHHAKSAASPSPSPAAATEETKPEATPTPAPPEATPAPEGTPKPSGNGLTTQIPFVPSTEKPQAPLVETKTPAEEEEEESSRFQAAKTKAMQDPHLQELQSKADSAIGDEARVATRRYYKALYSKMRAIDPSLSDRIDRTEEATMRRVEQLNTQ
jgi:hypothetical protein